MVMSSDSRDDTVVASDYVCMRVAFYVPNLAVVETCCSLCTCYEYAVKYTDQLFLTKQHLARFWQRKKFFVGDAGSIG